MQVFKVQVFSSSISFNPCIHNYVEKLLQILETEVATTDFLTSLLLDYKLW